MPNAADLTALQRRALAFLHLNGGRARIGSGGFEIPAATANSLVARLLVEKDGTNWNVRLTDAGVEVAEALVTVRR